ncbi:Arylsulfatase [Limihaloglobus sulfuriphilus]|uniref:Arylsulfatase n=1 Tax=Limihaloglobus sulfuriphilus TaxID=1851148 RepID=A0A1Q2MEE4_9BACT|nr:sulfatase-like hydrolase/transferase [Limihaloglobus sulfuriphilus]AQQ71019.1 Arylsulfatase [Limihaloglobus sulfuriphilus]
MIHTDLNRRNFLKSFAGAIAAAGLSGCLSSNNPAKINCSKNGSVRPNFVIFLSDDHGYADLSCLGTEGLSTPNLDALASSGQRMTNWYCNSPICAPSRAALMSGRYPIYAGMNVNVKTARHNTGLPLQTPTLAEALKKLNYQTSIFGKWHLGANEAYWPISRGFDHWFGMKGGCVDFYSHILYYEEPAGLPPIHDLYENGDEVWENGRYLTELITERAVGYFNDLAKKSPDKPFFSYIAYTDPHYPMHAPGKYVDMFSHLPPQRRIMAAKIKALDESVGTIMQTLKANGQLENTVIFFMGDNGPSREIHCWLDETVTPYEGGKTGGFRGHKMSLFEGGLRVPAIISWPGQIPEGIVCNETGSSIDIFPTFVKLAGGDLSEYELDGRDFMPTWIEGRKSPHQTLFWEFRGQVAVREGHFKLVLNGVDVDGVSEDDKIHLADLSSADLDNVNVKDKYPEQARRLKNLAQSWYAEAKNYYDINWEKINQDQRSFPPYYKK